MLQRRSYRDERVRQANIRRAAERPQHLREGLRKAKAPVGSDSQTKEIVELLKGE